MRLLRVPMNRWCLALAFLGIVWVGVLLMGSTEAALAARAGGSSPTRGGSASRPEAGERPAASNFTTVTQVRIGSHPGYTRVVLELAGQQEWSLQEASAGLRILVPGGQLAASIRRVDLTSGVVRSVEPTQRDGGVEVAIACDLRQVKVRTMTLTSPDRIVVDLLTAGTGGEIRAALPAAPPSGRRVEEPPSRPREASAGPVRNASVSPQRPATPDPGGRVAVDQPAAEPGASRHAAPKPLSPPEQEPPARALTVVLDPGHGGHDTGAMGPTGLMEKDVVLDLAGRLRALLQRHLGLRVLMTRTEDVFVPLPERSAFANRAKADFFLSLHVNGAGQRGAVGFETFFFAREPSDSDARASAQRENLIIDGNGTVGKEQESLLKMTLADMAVSRDMKESSDLAERLLSALDKILKIENRGVKSGPFYVLATAAMPAVLVESAFITNPREERKLRRQEYRQRLAEALFEAIAAYKLRYEQRLGFKGSAPAGARS